jgi:hypothetical protein
MKTPVYILIFLVFSLSFTPAQAVAPQPSTCQERLKSG